MVDSNLTANRTFLARFGATILRGGVAAIPNALYRYQRELGLAPQLIWFISALLSHKWDAEMPHPSLVKMAEQTGVSRQQLHKYQKELIAKGWLTVINRSTRRGGKDTNFYDMSQLFARLESLLERDAPPAEDPGNLGTTVPIPDNPRAHPYVNARLHTYVNHGLHHQDTVLEEAIQSNSNSSKCFEKGDHEENADNSDGDSKSGQPEVSTVGPVSTMSEEKNARTADIAPSSTKGGDHRAFHQVGETLAKLRHKIRPPSSVEDRQVILTYIAEFAEELGDEALLASSVTRAVNLYRRSGLGLGAFTSRLHEARSKTKDYAATIKKRQTIGGPGYGSRNKMPFFFALVEELLGLRVKQKIARSHSGEGARGRYSREIVGQQTM